jgi:hypothetical protein
MQRAKNPRMPGSLDPLTESSDLAVVLTAE